MKSESNRFFILAEITDNFVFNNGEEDWNWKFIQIGFTHYILFNKNINQYLLFMILYQTHVVFSYCFLNYFDLTIFFRFNFY